MVGARCKLVGQISHLVITNTLHHCKHVSHGTQPKCRQCYNRKSDNLAEAQPELTGCAKRISRVGFLRRLKQQFQQGVHFFCLWVNAGERTKQDMVRKRVQAREDGVSAFGSTLMDARSEML